MISWLFLKTSFRCTILLDPAHALSTAISWSISAEQSTAHLTREENFAAYSTPESRWVHLRTVAKRPLKGKGGKREEIELDGGKERRARWVENNVANKGE